MTRITVLALMLVPLSGCHHEHHRQRLVCHQLFGRPSPHTGLSSDVCQGRCDEPGFEPPAYDEAFRAELLEWTLVNPYAPLEADPYASGLTPVHPTADAVCAVQRTSTEAREYRLVDYASEAAARADGAMPTHFGNCGVCSTLQDLTVYMEQHDLTHAARHCAGMRHAGSSRDVECLRELGFTEPCAQIWAYNTRHTASVCRGVCVEDMFSRYHRADGTMNACLRCDEEHSGPVFMAVAGRTRRDTGLPTAICRPCSEVRPLVHRYE